MSDPVAASFFAYIRRRRALMAGAGGTAIVLGVVGAVLVGNSGAVVWLGGLATLGLLALLGSWAGASMVKDASTLATGRCQTMDLTTWPYRTVRSLGNNRVLVSLDVPGSVDRTPLAEFKAVWYTPGKAFSNAPTKSAEVYGTVAVGETVFAVGDDESCYLGRISRTRPARGE